MTPFTEANSFDAAVNSYDTADPVQGGPGGVANNPLQSLVNRTRYLFNQTALILLDLATLAPLNSPVLTGTPTSPTPPAGDNSNKVATTAFAQQLFGVRSSQTLTGASIYTVPANVYAIYVERWGPGGPGGGASPGTISTGGGAGAYEADWAGVTPGQQIAYSAGQGPAGGSPTATGVAGSATTFGALAPAAPGQPGASSAIAGGLGGRASGASQVSISGANGEGGFLTPAAGSTPTGIGGRGGSAARGGAGGAIANGNPGLAGSGVGAGGGGGGSTNSQGFSGGAGQNGGIVVSY